MNNLKLSEVKNIIILHPKGVTERFMLNILKDKYGDWFEYNVNFMRIIALATLAEKFIYYAKYLLEHPTLFKSKEDIKWIYNLKMKLQL
jgi:hypothetical protein